MIQPPALASWLLRALLPVDAYECVAGDLEEALRAVAVDKNLTVRLAPAEGDEAGALVDGFNTLIFEIQRRDKALQRAAETAQAQARQLEAQAAERRRVENELAALTRGIDRRVAERAAAVDARAHQLDASRRALEKQARILQSILDSMSDGVIVMEEAGK